MRPHYHPAYQLSVRKALSHAEAERLLGTHLQCKGIHLPDDPSPKVLSGQAAEFWHAAYENASQYYGGEDAESRAADTARKTAWKSVRMFFLERGGRWVLQPALPRSGHGPVSYIGNPGDFEQLGVCIEYTFVDGDANLQIRRFPKDDPPYLYWSKRTRTCYVFPGSERGPCLPPDLKSESAKNFKIWAQRPAQCLRMVAVPEVNLRLDGMFDTVVYTSDKWHDPNPNERMLGSQEYIHQVGDGVGLWQASGEVPPAIVFTGGCMDLEERGLIH
jgi:cation transport regulator ChaB